MSRREGPPPGVFDLRRMLGRAPTAQEFRDARAFSEPDPAVKRAALKRRLEALNDYGRRHGRASPLRREISEIEAELLRLENQERGLSE